MSAIDDSEIIARLLDDDQSVLATVLSDVVPRHWPLLSARFRDSLSIEDLEDVVAKSLAKVWNGRHTFDFSRGDFSGWFYVILRNSALDLLRRRAPKVEEYLEVEQLLGSPARSDAELRDALAKVVATLSEREQNVVLPLFERSGVSIAELSDQLSISRGAVRQLRFRALRKLNIGLAEVGLTTKRTRTTFVPSKEQTDE